VSHDDALRAADVQFARDGHDFALRQHLGAFLLVGSHAYGTATAESDHDYFAVIVPPVRHLLGLGRFEGWEPGKDAELRDTKGYSIEKFVRLALAGNPNVIEMLFLPEPCYLDVSPSFQLLLDHRDAFLSRKVFGKFSSYAAGQLKKMEQGKKERHMGHRRMEVVQRCGYDPKDASRCIHLLFMGHEIATRGIVNPRLTWGGYGHEVVMAIKAGVGLWSLPVLKEYAALLAESNEKMFHTHCPLPAEPNTALVEDLLITIHRHQVTK
jgi:hypothetical protein